MKIRAIFELIPASLYSVKFENETDHEFIRLFDLWNDTEYLEDFFETNRPKLINYWNGISTEDAVIRTRTSANRLESKIIRIAKRGLNVSNENLSGLFKPLHNHVTYVDNYEKNKAKGSESRSWLRMYAIRIDVNLFVISGGGIKLTRTMNEDHVLIKELKKLDLLRDYLIKNEDNNFETYELSGF
ncbi:MAG: hypothetical protein ABIN80_17730 [Dyadobacter sp.]|uniref:hypothetical protein n=1 Tax=Dyadobacter sp. TaxID=1914288 RepID=UPI003264D4E9